MKKNIFKRKIFYIPTIIIVLLVMFLGTRGGSTTTYTTADVKRGSLTQEVTVSGTVKAKQAVDLAFEKTGRVRSIPVSVGDIVTRGTVLATLESGVDSSTLEDAQAKLSSKQAHYDDLKAGGRPEEVQLKETSLAKAKSDLATDYSEIPNLLSDAFNKADNAVHRQADILFSNPTSATPSINFNSTDQQAVNDAQAGRTTVETALTGLKKVSQTLLPTDTDSENALVQAKTYLVTINDFLIKTNRALNASINISDATLATDKDALNTARTNINTALTNITNQIQTITTQKITIETAKNEVTVAKLGATDDALAGALADIKSAEANVRNAVALLGKTVLLSPIDGIVTRQDAKVGQIAPANTNLISVASNSFKIEAFIPEVDIAKVSISNRAHVTLDAYGSDITFPAHVTAIDPAETVIDGVSTYKTTLEFDIPDPRIRSGMTANTTITTAERSDALLVPQRAVIDKGGKKIVQVITSETDPTDREVVVGIRGSSGEIEILQGLTAGEKVVTSVKK